MDFFISFFVVVLFICELAIYLLVIFCIALAAIWLSMEVLPLMEVLNEPERSTAPAR